MGRRRGRTKLVSIKIDEDTLLRLDTLSREMERCRSDLIRAAIIQYIASRSRMLPRVIIIRD